MSIHRIRLIVYILFTLLLAGNVVHSNAQDFDKVQIQTEKITQGIYMLIGRGGNIGVSVGEDSVFMIDDQYAPLTDKIKTAIAAISEQSVQFIINTHWHQDHTGGNENFGGAGAVIVAHENVRKRMSEKQFLEFFKMTVPASPKSALPIITFTRDVTFHLNGDEMHVFHVEHAHTDGDAIIYFRKSNVIHMGDVFFEGMYPFIDLSAGGSIDGMIAAVDLVLPMMDRNTRVIPGHGPMSDKAGLDVYRAMLASVRNRIAREVEAGKTLDEVVASKTTQEFDAAWGQGFLKPDKFVEIIYKDLISKGKKKSEQIQG
jgi:glyoxylase-like metal-dependent hydrolase (beta-lactamase superfamily II)